MTGILGDGSGGGHFGAEVKFAGYDHIIVQGRAPKPVYIWLNGDEVEIRDAQHLWGKTTWETSTAIREELGDRYVRTLSIGPAGEHLANFACAITDEEAVPSKTGTGAVMGSKNLKAVAARGSKSVKVADPKRYVGIIRKWWKIFPTVPYAKVYKDIGTPFLVKMFNDSYNLAIKNAQELHRPEEEISHFYGENFVPKYRVRDFACFACRVPCQKFVRIHDGPLAGEKGRRPEYGPIISMCTHLAVFDFPFALKVTNLINQYGMGAEELGPAMAMIFECYQRGILTRKDTDGLKLEWGNRKAILELIRKIAYREGFGDIVADGCVKAAKRIGKGAEQYAYHIKGMTHPDRQTDYMPAVLGFAVSTRGWDHMRGSVWPYELPETKFWDYDPAYAVAVRDKEHVQTICDSAEICKILSGCAEMHESLAGISGVLSALTGVDLSEERLHKISDKIYNVERAYLVRSGIRRKDDLPPRHFLETPYPDGPSKGKTVDKEKFNELLDAWYEVRGSDKKTGAPTRETLEKLDLKYVADDLEKTGVYEE